MRKLEFTDKDKILILAPHPDDESIACAGVLLNYPQLCTVVVLTDGRLGSDDIPPEELRLIRQKEFKAAMDYAKVSKYEMLDICDGSLSENTQALEKIDYSQYNYVFCPNVHENHEDHKIVYKAIEPLLKKLNIKIMFYEVWSPIANPTHYIDISNIVKKKQNLISRYKSQTAQVDYYLRISGLNCYRGLYPNVKYAEAFESTN